MDVQRSFVSLPPSACHVHIAVRRNDFPKLYAMSWRGMGGDYQRIAVGRHSMWETRSHGDAKLPSKHGTDENTSGLELCCRPWLTPLSLEQQLGDTQPKSIAVRGQLARLRVRPAFGPSFGHQRMGLI